MSRKPKFRAWDGKAMFNVDVLAISECTWGCPDYGKRGVSLAYQPSIEIMQFTGFHDKNGKEVYEGDIVEAYKHNETRFVHEVVWRSGVLWFGNWNWVEFQNIFRNIKVIGNKWENKLMEVAE